MEVVAPSSEAIYAAITSALWREELAELQDMLGALEASLARTWGRWRRRGRRGE